MFSPTFNDPGGFNLPDHEIHVWYLPTCASDSSQMAQWLRLLDEDERRRRALFLNEKAKFEYLLAHAFVRTTLARYLDASPKSLRFQKNRYGRPELVAANHQPSLRFNLSHCDGLTACALAWRREIGIDVENASQAPIAEEVARSHFAAPEFEDYLSLPTAESRHARFLEYWTLKEAYLKARGTGLALPLDKFSCRWSEPDKIRLTIDPALRDDGATWQLRLLRSAPEFVAAIAARVETAEPIRIVEMVAKLEECGAG